MLQCRAMLLAAVALLGASAPLTAQQAGGTKAGTLACRTSGSLGLIFGSHQRLSCRFTPTDGGPTDHYVGSVVRLGVDLGVRAAGVMIWAVIAPTSGVHHGALAGHYVGASADASLGLGAGAK